jgi:hypothetical protein
VEARPAQIGHFADPLARVLGRRILFRNFPGPHSESVEKARRAYFARIHPPAGTQAPVDYRGRPRRTPAAAREEIAGLLAQTETTEADRLLLVALDRLITERFR